MLTVGHGTLSAEAFAALVLSAGVRLVIDVRRFPGSRRHPHFNREAMAQWLPEAGCAYRWEQMLGGFRKPLRQSENIGLRHPAFRAYADYMQTADFWLALDRVIAADAQVSAAGGRCAIVCSESLWWRCHRRLVADALVIARRMAVVHLFHDGRTRQHVPTEGVHVKDGRLSYPALNQLPQQQLGE